MTKYNSTTLSYIRTNIDGTYNVFKSAKLHQLDQILITSTSETYGTAQYTPINENHPLNSQSPYSASKVLADHLAISYYKCYKLPIKIIRPFNIYGPRQSARAIIQTIISQMLNNYNSIQIGNLSPTRDFTYVDDTCDAYLKIHASDSLFGEVINVGMNSEISMGDLTSLIASLMDLEIDLVKDKKRVRKMILKLKDLSVIILSFELILLGSQAITLKRVLKKLLNG